MIAAWTNARRDAHVLPFPSITLAHKRSGKSLRCETGSPKCRDSIPHTAACPMDPEPHPAQPSPGPSVPAPEMLWHAGLPWLLPCWGGGMGPRLWHFALPAPRKPPALIAPWYLLSRWEVCLRSTNSSHRPLGTEILSLVVYIHHSYFRSSWLSKVLLNNA